MRVQARCLTKMNDKDSNVHKSMCIVQLRFILFIFYLSFFLWTYFTWQLKICTSHHHHARCIWFDLLLNCLWLNEFINSLRLSLIPRDFVCADTAPNLSQSVSNLIGWAQQCTFFLLFFSFFVKRCTQHRLLSVYQIELGSK